MDATTISMLTSAMLALVVALAAWMAKTISELSKQVGSYAAVSEERDKNAHERHTHASERLVNIAAEVNRLIDQQHVATVTLERVDGDLRLIKFKLNIHEGEKN